MWGLDVHLKWVTFKQTWFLDHCVLAFLEAQSCSKNVRSHVNEGKWLLCTNWKWGSFFNYNCQILPTIDHLLTYSLQVDIGEGINLLLKKVSEYQWHFENHLPTSSGQRSLRTTPCVFFMSTPRGEKRPIKTRCFTTTTSYSWLLTSSKNYLFYNLTPRYFFVLFFVIMRPD